MTDRTITITLPESISRPRRGVSDEFPHEPSDCLFCRKPIEVADRIHKVGSVWLHSECARTAVGQMSTSGLWLALGEQLAEKPSRFTTRQTRVIVRALVDMLRIADEEPGEAWS